MVGPALRRRPPTSPAPGSCTRRPGSRPSTPPWPPTPRRSARSASTPRPPSAAAPRCSRPAGRHPRRPAPGGGARGWRPPPGRGPGGVDGRRRGRRACTTCARVAGVRVSAGWRSSGAVPAIRGCSRSPAGRRCGRPMSSSSTGSPRARCSPSWPPDVRIIDVGKAPGQPPHAPGRHHRDPRARGECRVGRRAAQGRRPVRARPRRRGAAATGRRRHPGARHPRGDQLDRGPGGRRHPGHPPRAGRRVHRHQRPRRDSARCRCGATTRWCSSWGWRGWRRSSRPWSIVGHDPDTPGRDRRAGAPAGPAHHRRPAGRPAGGRRAGRRGEPGGDRRRRRRDGEPALGRAEG